MTSYDNVIEKYKLRIQLASTMHIGSGDLDSTGILVHPVTGMPFVQASSIAGVLRKTGEELLGSEGTERLFGQSIDADNDNAASRLSISDGLFDLQTVKLEIRPRVAIDPKTGTAGAVDIAGSSFQAGTKFDITLIGSGAEFDCDICLSHTEDDNLRNWFESILFELANCRVRIGGQKSNGGGRVKAIHVLHHTFDLTDQKSREEWQKEQYTIIQYDDIISDLKRRDSNNSPIAYEFFICGETEGELLVKSIAIEGVESGKTISANMKNAGGQYIIPGSALKGVLRSHINQIAAGLGKEKITDMVFGTRKSDGKSAGIIRVDDVIVGKDGNLKDLLQHRIHIDKFTGGVISGSLFTERVISGDVLLHVEIAHSENADVAAGLLILAIRDLAAGAYNLGSGYSIGRGFVNLSRADITAGQNSAAISFDDASVSDEAGVIHKCLEEVKRWGGENDG